MSEKELLPPEYESSEDIAFLFPNKSKGGDGDGGSVFTISDKVNAAANAGAAAWKRRRCEMFNTRIKRFTFVLFLMTIMLTISLLIFLSYMHHSHRRNTTYNGFCNLLIPTEDSRHHTKRLLSAMERVKLDGDYAEIHSPAVLDYDGVKVLHAIDKKLSVIRTKNMCLVKSMRPEFRNVRFDRFKNNNPLTVSMTREHLYMVPVHEAHRWHRMLRGDSRLKQFCQGARHLHGLVSRSTFERMFGLLVGQLMSPRPLFPKSESEIPFALRMPRSQLGRLQVPPPRPVAVGHPSAGNRPCAEVMCAAACPSGQFFRLDAQGCHSSCTCHTPSLSERAADSAARLDLGRERSYLCATPQFDYPACKLRCAAANSDYRVERRYDCPVCRCTVRIATLSVARRRKRRSDSSPPAEESLSRDSLTPSSHPLDRRVFNANSCRESLKLFEGVIPADPASLDKDRKYLGSVDFVHNCFGG